MPLSSDEIAQCEAALIKAVREDIAIELAEYYGAAVFFGENVKPEQPNNEIRNAINHFARAFESDTWEEAKKNHNSAHSHIERAKRDSLKLASIGLFDEIRNTLRNAEAYHGSVDPAIILRKSALTEQRRDVYIKESAGYTGTTAQMLKLFLEARTFLSDLEKRYPSPQPKRRRALFWIKLKRHLFSLGVAFALGASSGVFGNYIWSKIS